MVSCDLGEGTWIQASLLDSYLFQSSSVIAFMLLEDITPYLESFAPHSPDFNYWGQSAAPVLKKFLFCPTLI